VASIIIKVSWLKYILASLGPIFIVTGIADRNLSNVMVGCDRNVVDFRVRCRARHLVIPQENGGFANVIAEGAKPVTPLKRKVWGFAIIAFGVLIAPSGSGQ
jgi:hypothetical protein